MHLRILLPAALTLSALYAFVRWSGTAVATHEAYFEDVPWDIFYKVYRQYHIDIALGRVDNEGWEDEQHNSYLRLQLDRLK